MIEEKISYKNGKIRIKYAADTLGNDTRLPMVEHTRYHTEGEGGGESIYYYLELTEEQFNELLGSFMEEK